MYGDLEGQGVLIVFMKFSKYLSSAIFLGIRIQVLNCLQIRAT